MPDKLLFSFMTNRFGGRFRMIERSVLNIALICMAVVIMLGCSSRTSSSGVAGNAYVEDEHGNLIPVDLNHETGVASAPVRPSENQEDWLTEFELMERSGRTVSSQELRGQPYVVSFFFTTCPTICKRQNEKVKLLQKQFQGQPIRLISITCDPDVDVPEVLSIYADQFGADAEQWLFLTGELDYIRRVGAEMYFIAVDRRFHADKFLLVDAEGRIYRSYAWPEEEAWTAMLRDIQIMLDAGGVLPPT